MAKQLIAVPTPMQTPRTERTSTPPASAAGGSVAGSIPAVPEDAESKLDEMEEVGEDALESRRLSQLPPKERYLTLGVYGLPHIGMKQSA